MQPKGKTLISFVIPCFNEIDVFPLLKKELLRLSDKLKERYRVEFILVDDGSHDGTWDAISDFALEDSRVSAVQLSRNFGHQLALTCGYDMAQGDAVISIDADLQDPPAVCTDLIKEWEKGNDIVLAIRKKRNGETKFKKLTAWLFYRIFHAIGNPYAAEDAGDFRLMSRRSVTAFNRLREHHRYIRGIVGWLGFRVSKVYYVRNARPAGETKYSLSRMVRFAMDAVISFSSFPLRLAYLFSGIASSIIFLYIIYVIIKHFFLGAELVPGWTSLLISIVIFGFFNLLSLGLIGEYIGRIYNITKDRPLYLIQDVITDGIQKQTAPYPTNER